MVSKVEAMQEIMIEEEWRLSRKFMREIMDAAGTHIPIVILLVSDNLQEKWQEYTKAN